MRILGGQYIRFDSSTIREGPEAARRQAERRLLDNIPFFEDNVVKYYVSEEGNRKLAKKFVEEVSSGWYELAD